MQITMQVELALYALLNELDIPSILHMQLHNQEVNMFLPNRLPITKSQSTLFSSLSLPAWVSVCKYNYCSSISSYIYSIMEELQFEMSLVRDMLDSFVLDVNDVTLPWHYQK